MMMEDNPEITGKWTNIRTGEVLMANGAIMDGENMLVMTNKGTIDMGIFSRDYIQVSDEEVKGGPMVSPPTQPIQHSFGGIEAESIEALKVVPTPRPDLNRPIGIVGTSGTNTTNPEPPKPKYNEMVEKLFSKIETIPTVEVNITWPEYPTKELEMLKEFFDVKDEDINRYFFDKYVIVNNLELKVNS